MSPKILFGVYPWAFDCPGGGERQLLAYKEHLTNMGIYVDLYDQWNPRIKEYDIFHFFSVMPGSYQLCHHIKSQGLKLVISPNLWVTEETKYLYPHDEIKRLLDIADKIIVNSKLEALSLSQVYNLPIEIFNVVYNGIEHSFLDPIDKTLFKQKFNLLENHYILNVANIEPRKNQLKFLEALKSYPEFALVIIGHIRDEQYAQQCSEIGKDQFIFIGDLPYGSDLLRSAYKGCSFFAMPSTLETPSIAALEAAGSGTKILITSEGSTKEYFDNYASYINPLSVESIKKAIQEIVNTTNTANLQLHIQNKYTWDNVVNELSNVYKNLISIDIKGVSTNE